VRYADDGFGRVVTETHIAAGGGQIKHIATTYNTLSRSVQVVQTPSNVTTTYSYATVANEVSVATIAHAGITTTITYDEHGREASRAVTGTSVNLTGEVLLRDAEGRRTEWKIGGLGASAGYDEAGKLVSQRAPGLGDRGRYRAGRPPRVRAEQHDANRAELSSELVYRALKGISRWGQRRAHCVLTSSRRH